jgi:hypothetical protein
MDRKALAANCESFPRLHIQTTSALALDASSCSAVVSSNIWGVDVGDSCNVDSRWVDGFASSSESGMSSVEPVVRGPAGEESICTYYVKKVGGR